MANFFTLFSDFKDWRASRTLEAFTHSQFLTAQLQWRNGAPSWTSLSSPEDFERAARENPVVYATIDLLASSASNGEKVAVDIKSGEIIPWTDDRPAIRKTQELLTEFPNPMQSWMEFNTQGIFYQKVFGNRYVYVNMPHLFDKEIDLLDINTLINLPSQFVSVKDTGKWFNQTTIEGIVEGYALTTEDPVKIFKPSEIIHFNEVNISSDKPFVMGISPLEALKKPITNIQYVFEAMNTILRTRGMSGIIHPKKSDGMGANVPLLPREQEELQEKFKATYGLRTSQNPFLISPMDIGYIKTIMNSEELGIYKEFSNNAILVANQFKVPPELVKTYVEGATYENQSAAVERLYQDATIPMVNGEDLYWTRRLNTKKYGFIIKTTWDHIPALQTARKARAVALNLSSKPVLALYDDNVITWNQLLKKSDLPTVDGGDVYKWERGIPDEKKTD